MNTEAANNYPINEKKKAKIDELGRITIPIEMRKKLGINLSEPVRQGLSKNNEIIIEKITDICSGCGATDNLSIRNEYSQRSFCPNCSNQELYEKSSNRFEIARKIDELGRIVLSYEIRGFSKLDKDVNVCMTLQMNETGGIIVITADDENNNL